MTQPTFVPIPESALVRPSIATPAPEIGRAKKPGLLGAPFRTRGVGQGTPTPDAGFALTLAERAVHELKLDKGLDEHDVVAGVAALAAKRAGALGRGPSQHDVQAVLDHFGFGTTVSAPARAARAQAFRGIGHSYFLLMAFVDGVTVS